MSPECFVTLVTATAIELSEGKTSDQLDLMAVFLTQIASTLATISVYRGTCEGGDTRASPIPPL